MARNNQQFNNHLGSEVRNRRITLPKTIYIHFLVNQKYDAYNFRQLELTEMTDQDLIIDLGLSPFYYRSSSIFTPDEHH